MISEGVLGVLGNSNSKRAGGVGWRGWGTSTPSQGSLRFALPPRARLRLRPPSGRANARYVVCCYVRLLVVFVFVYVGTHTKISQKYIKPSS